MGHYDELGLQRSATDAEIRKAYKQLALKYHPDKTVNGTEEAVARATEKFRALRPAVELLQDSTDKIFEPVVSAADSLNDKLTNDSRPRKLTLLGKFFICNNLSSP